MLETVANLFLYPVSQDITESFDSLTSQHFAAFFRRSFAAYGVDDADAVVNKAEMDKPDPTPSPKKSKISPLDDGEASFDRIEPRRVRRRV